MKIPHASEYTKGKKNDEQFYTDTYEDWQEDHSTTIDCYNSFIPALVVGGLVTIGCLLIDAIMDD